jgi:hypothetical protein
MTVWKSMTAAAILALSAALPLMSQTKGAATPAPAPRPPAAATSAAHAVDGGTPSWIKPETAEERKTRLAVSEDPGPDPDPNKVWHRLGRDYRIEKSIRRDGNIVYEAYDHVPEGWVRPNVMVNAGFELYQRNDKYIWYWVAVDPRSELASRDARKLTPEQVKALEKLKPEFALLDVPDSPKTIRFEESSEGLPTSGSWRNSLAVADVDGDGFMDIIAPPQRGANNGLPAIFRGDGKGHWRIWSDVVWPAPIDYGAVVAADFNHDGKVDLAFAVHLNGVRVWLGDGKGHFVESSKGLPVDSFPTRKLIATDIDKDGATDIIAISEGATRAGMTPGGRVRVFLNRKNGSEWQQIDAAGEQANIAGDTLVVGNFNGDKYPDFAAGSIIFQSADLLWLSDGPKKWKLADTKDAIIPTLAMYGGLTTGHFASKKLDDVVMTWSRSWPEGTAAQFPPPAVKGIGGLDLITFTNGVPKRKPIVRFAEPKRAIMGIGTGDFDGDGNEDIAYLASAPKREFVILLGDGKGGFTRAHVEGLAAEDQTNYDLKVADVNGDSRPDLIVMYETDKQGSFGVQNGSIHVFLNRGVASAAGAGKK